MAFSFQTHTIVGTGVQTFNLTIGYVARDHITAYLDGVVTAFTWLSDTQIELDVTGGTELVIRRSTPKDDETDLVVDFEDAATITEPQLDLVFRQLIFIAQEAIDVADAAMQKTVDESAWDAEGLPLTNLGAPLTNNDAVRLIDLANALISSGNLPAVTVANNNYLLLVVAGAWQAAQPSTVRTALGLTALATTSPGVASGQVPVLGAGGELPAGVAGTNLNIAGNASITALQAAIHYGGAVVAAYVATAADVAVPKFTPSGPTDITWVSDSTAHAKFDTITRYGPFTGSAWPDGITANLSTYGGITNGILIDNPTSKAARFVAIFEASLDHSSALAAERGALLLYGTTVGFSDTTIDAVGTSAGAVAGATSQVQIGDTILRLGESRTVSAVSATEITVSSAFTLAGVSQPFLVIPAASVYRPRIASCIAARTGVATAVQLDGTLSPRTDFDVAATWAQADTLSAQGTGEIRRLMVASFTVGAASSADVAGVFANLNGSSATNAVFANYRKNPFRLTIIRVT